MLTYVIKEKRSKKLRFSFVIPNKNYIFAVLYI